MNIYILNRRSIVPQRHLRKSIESDRQVFVVRIMPAVSEFDDTLGMLRLCGRQVDGHSAMTDASTECSDPHVRHIPRISPYGARDPKTRAPGAERIQLTVSPAVGTNCRTGNNIDGDSRG